MCSVLLAAGMAFSVVWQRSAARSYEKGGRASTVFAEGVEAGLADAAGTETPVVTDYPVWGGDLEAESAFLPALSRMPTPMPTAWLSGAPKAMMRPLSAA